MRRHFIRTALVVFVLAMTFGAGVWAQQMRPQLPPVRPAQPPPSAAKVYSGNDIGFRVERMNGGVPSGRLVVRNDAGEWIEVDFAVGIKRLTSR